MVAPSSSDEPSAKTSCSETALGIEENELFNPLTVDLNDLRLTHDHCWLWPQIAAEFDRLDIVVETAQAFFEPLSAAPYPDWAMQAAIGLARSNAAIHEHAECRGSYIEAARSLWTARIPRDPPTFSDAQIYALLAIHEARLAAESYAEIAAGLDEEMQQAEITAADEEDIRWLRAEMADWERSLWRDAVELTGSAERFLLMAHFAVSPPGPQALKQAESQIATLRRQARAAAAVAAPYRQGRKRGALGNLARALIKVTREAGSTMFDAVLQYLNEVEGEDIEGIRFQIIEEGRLYYLDLARNVERSIAIDSLKRRLKQLPDV
jgi:hypothetical protein